MNSQLDDYLILDGTAESENVFEYYAALQRQINNGSVWHMQGSMGRAAMDAIKAGYCVCGTTGCQDYWGNHVPSRSQLQSGTKGTKEFVAKHRGEQWAEDIDSITT